MLAVEIADVRSATVRLHPQQFLEVDLMALVSKFCCALLGSLHLGKLRGGHPPARERQFGRVGLVAHDRGWIVGKDAGHRRQVSGAINVEGEQLADGVLVLRHRIDEVIAVAAKRLSLWQGARKGRHTAGG